MSEASRSSIKSLHSDLLSQTEVFLEELRVRQETQRHEEEEAERQRKIQEERERRERQVSSLRDKNSGTASIRTPNWLA